LAERRSVKANVAGSSPALAATCKYCHLAARKRLKEKAAAYKGGKYNQCDYDKCLGALTFHHLDPSKNDFSIVKLDHRK
jgi:hypothetical protein